MKLYHKTLAKNLPGIRANGLLTLPPHKTYSWCNNAVYFTPNLDELVATKVFAFYGHPAVILEVDEKYLDHSLLRESENGFVVQPEYTYGDDVPPFVIRRLNIHTA